MTNHLANPNVTLILRTNLANLALQLADAMIEQEIACFENTRKHGPEDDSDALLQAAIDSIDNVHHIRKQMQDVAREISTIIINA